jgi:hypothetical protein
MAQAQTADRTTRSYPITVSRPFTVESTSEPRSGWVRQSVPLLESAGTGPCLRETKTAATKYSVNNHYRVTDSMNGMKPNDQVQESDHLSLPQSWLIKLATKPRIPDAWAGVLSELREYAAMEAGWRGPGTDEVSEEVAEQAEVLLRQLALELPAGYVPMVGADDDGRIVMTWSVDDLLGNLSVRDKGLYSYFVQRGGKVIKNGKAEISRPVPVDLLSLLRL